MKNIFNFILLIIFTIIFCVSAKNLYSIYSDYKEGSEAYEHIINMAISTPQTTEDILQEDTAPEISYSQYVVDFQNLLEINKDVIAWIRFDSPEIINYPVLFDETNDTYLHTNLFGNSNSAGALFIDATNSTDFSDANTIIYGHNMKNNTMFGALSDYIDEEFYKNYPYFYIYTPDGMAAKYQIASVREISITNLDSYTINFSSTKTYQAYINTMLQTSYYDTNAPLDVNSSIITLSTCTSSDEKRFLVQGVKIEEVPINPSVD